MNGVKLERERRPKRRWRVLVGGMQVGLVYRRAGSRDGWWAELHAEEIPGRPVMHFKRAVSLHQSRDEAVDAVALTTLLEQVLS